MTCWGAGRRGAVGSPRDGGARVRGGRRGLLPRGASLGGIWGRGALVGRGLWVHEGPGGWVLLGVPGGDQRKMPIEETGGTGMFSARFPNPSRDRSAVGCWHRGSGCLGESTAPQQGKTPSNLAGAWEPSRLTGSSFPAQSPLNHGRSGPGPVGLCQSPACDTNSCVTPTCSPPLWEL